MNGGRSARLGEWGRACVTICALLALASGGCTRVWEARFIHPPPPITLDPDAAFVKCHMSDGTVYVFDRWSLAQGRWLSGSATYYSASREMLKRGEVSLDLATVALIETNRPQDIPRAGYIVVGVISAVATGVGTYCASSPKACFGSCPTFYGWDGRAMALQAEGFSASIARSLEETDVDALASDNLRDGPYALVMRNEAFETHFVDSVRLLSVARRPGRGVVRAGGTFFDAGAPRAPAACATGGVDCRPAVAALDGEQFSSRADPTDLAAREKVVLSFADVPGRRALLLSARNTFVNTFVYYQLLAFMGRSASDWLLTLENGGTRAGARLREMSDPLAHITVRVSDERGAWREAGKYSEVGPIATDTEAIPLPGTGVDGRALRVELEMAKGSFRLDRVALVAIGDEATPRVLTPSRVKVIDGRGDAQAARLALAPGGERLVTYPGDAYELLFDLPAGSQQLFLESRGYYYEWMRREWLAEENPDEVRRFFAAPRDAYKRWAPAFSRIEPGMERAFWTSRFRLAP
jgi:hypothetical protein